jgi:predicted membrane protein
MVAAIGNGVAFMAAGFVLASLLSDDVLAQFYVYPRQARTIIVLSTGLIGAVIGAMVLLAFQKSELVRRDVAGRVANTPHPAPDGG